MCVCVCVCVCVCFSAPLPLFSMSVFLSVRVCWNFFECVCLCLYVSVGCLINCLCVSEPACQPVSLSFSLYQSDCLCLSLCVCLSPWLHLCTQQMYLLEYDPVFAWIPWPLYRLADQCCHACDEIEASLRKQANQWADPQVGVMCVCLKMSELCVSENEWVVCVCVWVGVCAHMCVHERESVCV